MGYTAEYIRGFFEFWFGLMGAFIIIIWLNNHNGWGSCRHLRGLGDNQG